MLKLFKSKSQTLDDTVKNVECNALIEKIMQEYSKDMTGIIIIVEKEKETYGHVAGLEPALAIFSLDQFHHRIQHEGLKGYD